MTTTWGRDYRYGHTTRTLLVDDRAYAVQPLRRAVLAAARSASGQMTLTGETSTMQIEPLEIAADSTTHIYAIGTAGVERHTQADIPVFVSRFLFDAGQGAFVFVQGGFLVVPAGQGGVQTISKTNGEVEQLRPGVLSQITAACYDATNRRLWVFDQKRGQGASLQVGTAGQLTYGARFSAPNCRDIVRAVVDTQAGLIFILNRHRIVSLSTAADWQQPTLAIDYGVKPGTFTDFVKIGTDAYWVAIAEEPAAGAVPYPSGPQYGSWDGVAEEMLIACPRMSLWNVANVVPYWPAVAPDDAPGGDLGDVGEVVVITEPPTAPPPAVILPDPPVITSLLTSDATEGDAWSYTITATGAGPISFSSPDLPSWATINAATGVITGTPPMTAMGGVRNITIRATNAGGSDTETLALTIAPSVASFANVLTNGEVHDMVRTGNLLYIVGEFTTVTDASGTVTRNRCACLNLTTALFTSWNPGANGGVRGVFVDDPDSPTSVYLCGATATTIGGVTTRVARVHPTTGVVDPGWTVTTSGGDVRCGVVVGSTVYLGGSFTSLQGTSRNSAGAVSNGATATLQAWRPGNGDNVDANDWIIQYTTLFAGIRSMQYVSGQLLVGGGFFVRTTTVLSDYLAVGWGFIDPTTGVFSQAASGTGDITGGFNGCNYALSGDGKLYVSFNCNGGIVGGDQRMRSLPAWDVPPATAYAADRWAILSAGVPTIFPASPNGGTGAYGPQYIITDPDTTDFYLLGRGKDFFGVPGLDSMVRITSAGARNATFAPVWAGGGSRDIYCGVRAGPALIVGGQFNSVTLSGQSRSFLTAVNATTGATY